MRTFSQLNYGEFPRYGRGRANVLWTGSAARLAADETDDLFSGWEKEKKKWLDLAEEAFQQHDFEALFEGLELCKFSKETAKSIVGLVSTAASVAAGIGAVVTAIEAAGKIIEWLGLGEEKFDQEKALKEIGQKVSQIYDYLEQSAINELYKQASAYRGRISVFESALRTAAGSQSPSALERLGDELTDLDIALHQMLSISNGYVPFSRKLYEKGDRVPNLFYNVCGTPYLKYSDGSATPQLSGLSAHIWDPGHYADLLAGAVRQRVLAAATMEPLYRSTGYGRSAIESLAPAIHEFAEKWDNAFFEADPASCVLTDGKLAMYHRVNRFQPGILVGAMCPVTGISSLRIYDSFTMLEVTESGFMASGDGPDEYFAVDPIRALSDATELHRHLVDRTRKACGLTDMRRLHREVGQLGRPPLHTESVRFGRVETPIHPSSQDKSNKPIDHLVIIGQPETIRLGAVGHWGDPDREFLATRYPSGRQKVVNLRLGRRGRSSQTQIGYTLLIDDQEIELSKWSIAPAPEVPVKWFPSETIERTLTLTKKRVYESVQSRALSSAEEEAFDETGGTGGDAKRILINEHVADVKVRIRVEFNALPDGETNQFLGLARVTIEPLETNVQAASYLLNIDIKETHAKETPDAGITTDEKFVEGVNLHMIPSFLVAGDDFFEAYRKAYRTMLREEAAIELEATQQGLSLDDLPRRGDPGPKYITVLEASHALRVLALVDKVQTSPSLLKQMLRYAIPRQG